MKIIIRYLSRGRSSFITYSGITVGISGLPAPCIGAHVREAALGLPAQQARRAGGVCVADGDIAGASVCDTIGNPLTRYFLECAKQFKDAVALAGTEVDYQWRGGKAK